MEETTTTPRQNNSEKRGTPMWLLAVAITLAVIAIVLGIKLYLNSKEIQKDRTTIDSMKLERLELENQLQKYVYQIDSIKYENDTISEQLLMHREKINTMLKQKASDRQKIKMYQSELETMRKIMRSYIVQIDSLNTQNLQLRQDTALLSQKYKTSEKIREEQTQQIEVLDEVKSKAQRLVLSNIVAEGLNKNSKPKDKINKIEKIRVSLTVRSNDLAIPGTKAIYVRIINPDDAILPSSQTGGMFEYQGSVMYYSAKRDIDYNQEEISTNIYWDKNEELTPGEYFVEVYAEGFQIGTTSLYLK